MGWFEDQVSNVKRMAGNPATYLAPGLAIPNQLAGSMMGGGGGQSSQPAINADKSKNARNADIQAGYAEGRRLFYDNPDMQASRARLQDLSKGYNGQELGALRSSANSEIQGQRGQYLRQIGAKAARGGVGGARAAAIQGGADQGFMKKKADAERAMTLDNAKLVRDGNKDLQDFLMQQRFGELSTGLGYGQLGVSDRGAEQAAAAAAKQPKKGIIGQIFEGFGI